jgi:hypothetical protein
MPIGRPFVICSSCQIVVPCEPFNEWDFIEPNTKMRYLLTVLGQAFVFGLIPGLLYGVVDVIVRGDFDPLILAGALAGGLILVGGLRLAVWSSALRRSQRRVMDPMYQAKIVEFGMGGRAGQGPTPSRSNP